MLTTMLPPQGAYIPRKITDGISHSFTRHLTSVCPAAHQYASLARAANAMRWRSGADPGVRDPHPRPPRNIYHPLRHQRKKSFSHVEFRHPRGRQGAGSAPGRYCAGAPRHLDGAASPVTRGRRYACSAVCQLGLWACAGRSGRLSLSICIIHTLRSCISDELLLGHKGLATESCTFGAQNWTHAASRMIWSPSPSFGM